MPLRRIGLVFYGLCFLGLVRLQQAVAFSNDRSDNLAVYWGQDGAGHQRRLSFYCQDNTIDVIPMAFLYVFFGEGGQPVVDFSNICSQGGNEFPNTDLADCSFLASDIQQCQAKGKLVTISLGGATAKVGFNSASQANSFAEVIWDMFLGGRGNVRPFGDAVLDGIDLDIESGSPSYYATFVNRLRALSKGSRKRYFITAAPQCPFPDAKVGNALDNADFDAIYVQFYNNYCETSRPSEFNFATWDRWARTVSPNPSVKVYIGAPAGPKAAGSGYVNADALISMAKSAQKQYPSFGGVMLWDADTAYNNNRFDSRIKNAIRAGALARPSPSEEGAPDDTDDSGPKPVPNTSPASPVPNTSPASPVPNSPPASPEPDAEATVPADFRDPRATARVKRPSFTLNQRDEVNTNRPQATSRFFRY